MNVSRISKIAGLSLAGFVAATFIADKENVGPILTNLAGAVGATLGTLVARTRRASKSEPAPQDKPQVEEVPVDPAGHL